MNQLLQTVALLCQIKLAPGAQAFAVHQMQRECSKQQIACLYKKYPNLKRDAAKVTPQDHAACL